jgi:hypothetical protein
MQHFLRSGRWWPIWRQIFQIFPCILFFFSSCNKLSFCPCAIFLPIRFIVCDLVLIYTFYNVLLKCLPKFYSIISFTGVSHSHLSDHMSELVENTISDLEQSKVSYSVISYVRTLRLSLLDWKSQWTKSTLPADVHEGIWLLSKI